ncbi:MAG TPA: hypothetical protein VL354_08345 [Spirochaetia bacterium]|nr:hypothetical protein [Spirochaetia bacterium]
MRTRLSAITAATFALAISALCAPVFAGSVHLMGNLQADYLKGPSAQQIIDSFTSPGQPPFYGVGWEVIINKVGFGGDYAVDFTRTPLGTWWLDWNARPIFLGYHFFKSGYFLDPFVQAGVGCAGRVFLQKFPRTQVSDNLYISIYPFVAAGLGLDLSGFLMSAKVSYAPFMSAPPASPITEYPLGNVQVTLSAGIAIDW